MTDKQFPQEFRFYMTMEGTKKAIFMEMHSVNPLDCQNCGGHGQMYIFIATGGPFQSSPGPGKVGKWYDNAWWVGKTFSSTCPVCNGFGRDKDYTEDIYQVDTEKMEHEFERTRSIVKDD